MAEQEVIKHTKKIFTVWGSNKKLWHKIGDFVLEIFIIVFAISLSIYLHDRSVLQHQRHETKEFLLGLRNDLTTDINEMKEDQKSFTNSGAAFGYITKRKFQEPLSRDSIKKHYTWMFNTTGLIPNDGRFEGFKSSGKISTIENKELQNDIMDLYQENIPNLIVSTDSYSKIKQRISDYVGANRKRLSDSTSNILEILSSDVVYNISQSLSYVHEITERYNICISKMNKIIVEIDKEYPKKD